MMLPGVYNNLSQKSLGPIDQNSFRRPGNGRERKVWLVQKYAGIGDGYQIFFLDAKTNLVKMVQSPGQSPMTGAPVTQKVYVDEYQDLEGFTLPLAIRMTYDDEPFATGTVKEFKAKSESGWQYFQEEIGANLS